jgi:dethiobiotin synthetase
MNYFVTGIDTDSGKSLVSAILCEALQADYWKPIQAGTPTDTDFVKNLISNQHTNFHPESYLLKTPASPHAAAAMEKITISFDKIKIPTTENDLVIEGAGGCLVPVNDKQFVIDLAAQIQCTIIVVANLYLGSINHTLLTVNELKARKLPVLGIIFNGIKNIESQRIILKHSGWPQLLHIKKEMKIDRETVSFYAKELLKHWNA